LKPFRVGIDCYSLKFLGLSPFELLDWALINGADGVQFSETPAEAGDPGFLRELGQYARQNGLYLEWGGGRHIPRDLATGALLDIVSGNRRAAEQAALLGVETIRSCSGGLMRWNAAGPATETLLRETAHSLASQKSMFRDHGVTLAIETHFEFTTFELLRILELCQADPGDGLGICLDTMNLLTLLEDPVSAARRILRYVVTTHIKDGGLQLGDEGFVSFTAEIGRGIVDFPEIFKELTARPADIPLSIEDHGGDFSIPIFNPAFLREFPDLSVSELGRLLRLARETQQKMKEGRLAILDRAKWPAVGEERVKRDLRAVRAILAEGPSEAGE
jgi:sugar phosphate isomerase/epimerase